MNTNNPTVFCASCNEPGHSRRTSRLCRMNPLNLTLSEADDIQTFDLTPTSSISTGRRNRSVNPQSTLNIAKDLASLPTVRDDRGSMNCVCSQCGALMWIEERVSKSSRIRPEFQLCCCRGKAILPPLQATPSEISNLLQINDATSKEFRKNIRLYNSSLSFTSFGVNLDLSLANNSVGSYTFRIQESPYHLIGSVVPSDNNNPKFAQLYIYDAEQEITNRHAVAPSVNIMTLQQLQELMHRMNPFVAIFKNMTQIANDQRNSTDPQNNGIESLENIKLVFRAEGVPDRRRYNRPTHGSEIAAIIIGGENDDDTPNSRDIVVRYQDDSLTRVNESNQFYDPLHYVLLFPSGEPGWSINAKSISGNRKITVMEFYSFRLMYRPNNNHLLHSFGNLFQQYIVDSYAKMEQNRLSYIRHNQKKLRCEAYQGLQDAIDVNDYVNSADPQSLARIGKKVILPSSFIGGPRHMAQLYQDALSIVRRFGKPDYFITFTCNPKWPEIQRELLHHQKASDRPDLCTRVFNLKLRELLDDLTKKHVLGKVIAFIYTIEFQKRGLPHAHILLIVDPADKPQTIEDYDKIVSAEIPDPDAYPLAHETVIRNMVHGPCGLLNSHAVCMDAEKGCTKGYPKEFCEETTVNSNGGYPIYRRRNNGSSVPKTINGHTYNIDNRWIVPHNLYLCSKYDAHINVELCSSINSVKYVYKYVYKGHDRASMSVEQNDEIRSFVDARYVSAPEACWRLFSFSMHKEFPSHQRLAIHLEGEEPVYFNEDDDVTTVLERASVQETTLTSWFKTNANDPDARSVLYPNFPEEYVWHNEKEPRRWEKRQRGFGGTIGRIYAVSPKQTELYHLRMLLHHIPGATSFAHLRTVNGIVHPTFQDACRALHLLESDDQWSRCLEEAAQTQLPFSLRRLFTILLIFCAPSDPHQLWLEFRNELSEDYVHQLRNDSSFDSVLNSITETAYNNALLDIDDILATQHGTSITNYPGFVLPTVDTRRDNATTGVGRLIQEQERLNAMAQQSSASVNIDRFNNDQRQVFDTIMQCVERDGCESTEFPRIFFVDGPGGTGKTYLFNTLLKAVRSLGNGYVLAVASSGTAALLLDGGRTAHSMLKIPLETSSTTLCGIKPRSQLANLLKKTKLIIWDESSMINKSTLETVDRTFKDIFSENNEALSNVPFGGRLMLFGGDFRQVLPVVKRGNRSSIVNQCINRSFLWSSFSVLKLQINMRVQQAQMSNDVRLSEELQQFANMLLDIGNGAMETLKIPVFTSNRITDTEYIKIPESMLIQGDNLLNLLSAIYPKLFSTESNVRPNPQSLINSAILTPTNSFVADINRLLIEKFPGDLKTYYSADVHLSNEQNMQYPVELLHLIETGALIGSVVCIPRIKFLNDSNDAIQFSRVQFPVRLAFAMTINKAQGQTLEKVGLYLPKPVFSHGQLYVALSRVRQKESLKILIGKSTSIPSRFSTNHTRNVVYKEVFI